MPEIFNPRPIIYPRLNSQFLDLFKIKAWYNTWLLRPSVSPEYLKELKSKRNELLRKAQNNPYPLFDLTGHEPVWMTAQAQLLEQELKTPTPSSGTYSVILERCSSLYPFFIELISSDEPQVRKLAYDKIRSDRELIQAYLIYLKTTSPDGIELYDDFALDEILAERLPPLFTSRTPWDYYAKKPNGEPLLDNVKVDFDLSQEIELLLRQLGFPVEGELLSKRIYHESALSTGNLAWYDDKYYPQAFIAKHSLHGSDSLKAFVFEQIHECGHALAEYTAARTCPPYVKMSSTFSELPAIFLQYLFLLPERVVRDFTEDDFGGTDYNHLDRANRATKRRALLSILHDLQFEIGIYRKKGGILKDSEVLSDMWKTSLRNRGVLTDEDPDYSFLVTHGRQMTYAPLNLRSYLIGFVLGEYLLDRVREKLLSTPIESEEFRTWFAGFWNELFSPGPFVCRASLERTLRIHLPSVLSDKMKEMLFPAYE